MQPNIYPILDFDPVSEAIIEPSRLIKKRDYSRKVLLCFFNDVIKKLEAESALVRVDRLLCEMGENPIYRAEMDGCEYLVVHPGLGAPMGAAFMEEMIARGCDQFIACGGCGVLQPEIAVGHIMVPETAVRDEGTSYAYLQPASEIAANPRVLQSMVSTLEKTRVDYRRVKTWTTDAIYRETVERARLRKAQGCVVVEMETAAFMAVAQFRGVEFGQLLYAGDSVHEDGWDNRQWEKRDSIREDMFFLATKVLIDL